MPDTPRQEEEYISFIESEIATKPKRVAFKCLGIFTLPATFSQLSSTLEQTLKFKVSHSSNIFNQYDL